MEMRIVEPHLTKEYLEKYGNGDIFIETGTYMGDTIEIARQLEWSEIHSIELNQELAAQAKARYQPKVAFIWHGESPFYIRFILGDYASVEGKKAIATFWLDAHASGPLPGGESGGTPVLEELKMIRDYGHPDSTIFIDDRRLFGSAEWSGVKEEDAIALLKEINPNYRILYLDGHIPKDIICATVKA